MTLNNLAVSRLDYSGQMIHAVSIDLLQSTAAPLMTGISAARKE